MADSGDNLWRIGAPPFLGAQPLVRGLEAHPQVRLTRAVPSRLAELLEGDELDAALLPAIDYFRLTVEAQERPRHPGAPGLAIVPGIAVASRGPVGSVRLFCRADWPLIRHVALDPGSGTSNCLVRLILKEVYHVSPHYRWPQPDAGAIDRESHAHLLIGDRGLAHETRDYYRVLDLGGAWQRYARKPFVYAVWAARQTQGLVQLAELLTEAQERGLAARDEIARTCAAGAGVSPERAREHLFENIHYGLGPEELVGLQTFYRWAAKEELATQNVPIRLIVKPAAKS